MDPVIAELLTPASVAPATAAFTLTVLIITAFIRGWILSAFVVESLLKVQDLRIQEANRRADDYKLAWEMAEKRGDLLQELLDQQLIVGENVNKLLFSLPVPQNGDKTNGGE